MRRWLTALLLLLIQGYAAHAEQKPTTRPATQAAMLGLEAMLVFPGNKTKGQSDAIVKPDRNSELLQLKTKDGTRVAGLFGKPLAHPHGDAKPTLLFFYGNGMCMAYTLDIFDHLRKRGYNVILVDYPGYGMSDGSPSEAGCYASADAAYDYLLTRNDVDAHRIVACGWSLGAAVAIDLASRREVAGLATFSAFTNIHDMGKVILNKQVGAAAAALLLTCKFDNLAKIKTVTCPIFMCHGVDDRLVPVEMLDRLVLAASKPPKVIRVHTAGHNDLFMVGGDELYDRVDGFLSKLGSQ